MWGGVSRPFLNAEDRQKQMKRKSAIYISDRACIECGNLERYKSNDRCVICARARASVWAKDNPKKNREKAKRYNQSNPNQRIWYSAAIRTRKQLPSKTTIEEFIATLYKKTVAQVTIDLEKMDEN